MDNSGGNHYLVPTSPGLTKSILEEATADINIRNRGNILSPNQGHMRTFSQRTFGRLDKGSLRGSIFALCASAIGSGVLSLPYVLGLNGWILGVVFILVGAFAAGWSLFMIAESAIKSKTKNLSKLTNFVGGKKLERFLQINILVYLFGSCISYQIIISTLISRFL